MECDECERELRHGEQVLRCATWRLIALELLNLTLHGVCELSLFSLADCDSNGLEGL